MQSLAKMTFATVLVLGGASANAEVSSIHDNAARAAELSLLKARIAQSQSVGHNDRSLKSASEKTTKELIANPYRAYPPSCLGDGLPQNFTTPVYQTSLTLGGDPLLDANYSEVVKLTIWRVPCTSGLSATLLGIDRSDANVGKTDHYPVFPGVRINQGYPFDDSKGRDLVRIAEEQNTFFSLIYPDTPVIYNQTYVLENFLSSDLPPFDFNKSFSVRFDNFFSSGTRFAYIDVPAYNPANYPAASQPLPISGYMSGTWYDPAHVGEGIVFEVGEQSTTDRYAFFAWFTYDSHGVPYWLTGVGTFKVGDTSVVMETTYTFNGGFAGAFGASATANPWGKVTFSFPDCDSVRFTYKSYPTLVAIPAPGGEGTRNWKRVAQINGLTCK